MTVTEMPPRKRGSESPEYCRLPQWFFDACDLYVDQRRLADEPFFAAMLTGDVKGMVYGADDVSQSMLWLMLKYLYNHLPEVSLGSELALARWLAVQPQQEPETIDG